MIDFIRVHYRDKEDLEKFILNPKNFKEAYSTMEYHSGEVLYPYKTNLENMEIVVNEKSGYVKNSIHKLNNVLSTKVNQNYNDFTYSNLCNMIDYLKNKVVDVSSNHLTQLEFGLNIKVPIPAIELISKSVLMHKLDSHSMIKKFKGAGYLMTFEHYNYIIKIYDKSKQYNIDDQNILRFEIKFIDKKEFNNLGVFNINDLKSKKVLENLFRYLLKRVEELIIVDNFSEKDIPQKDFEKLNMYSSSSYWEKMKEKSRQYKSKQKKDYFSLLEKYNLLKTKRNLKSLLTEKFNLLLTN